MEIPSIAELEKLPPAEVYKIAKRLCLLSGAGDYETGEGDFAEATEYLRLQRKGHEYENTDYKGLMQALALKALAAKMTKQNAAIPTPIAPTIPARHRDAIATAIATAIKQGWDKAILAQVTQNRVDHAGISQLCDRVRNPQKQQALWSVWTAVNHAPGTTAPKRNESKATVRPGKHPGNFATHQLRSLGA
jgi:hypothetical protein